MVIALVCAGCATPAIRGPSSSATRGEGAAMRDVAPGAAIALDPAWRRPFDTQSALIAHGDVIVESSWSGVQMHDAARGERLAMVLSRVRCR